MGVKAGLILTPLGGHVRSSSDQNPDERRGLLEIGKTFRETIRGLS